MQRRSEQADAPLDSQLERGNKKRRSHKQHDRVLPRDHNRRSNEIWTSAEQQCYIYWGRGGGQTNLFSVVRAPSDQRE